MECERMTWKDITKNLTPEQVRTMERGVKKTGVCRRCKRSVKTWEPCPMNLPPLPIKPNCPMKTEYKDSNSRGPFTARD